MYLGEIKMNHILDVNIKRKVFKHSSDFQLKKQKDKTKVYGKRNQQQGQGSIGPIYK